MNKEKFNELCVWLNDNKKGLFLFGIVIFFVCVILMTLSLLTILWLVTLFPAKFASAPMQITFAGVGTLVTALGGLYTMYSRIADSEKNKTEQYRIDSELNSVAGCMPEDTKERSNAQ